MNIKTRLICGKILELEVESNGSIIKEDITDSNYIVDNDFIQSLLDLADELTQHNNKILGL